VVKNVLTLTFCSEWNACNPTPTHAHT